MCIRDRHLTQSQLHVHQVEVVGVEVLGMLDDEGLARLFAALLQLDQLLADGGDDGGDVSLVLLLGAQVALPLRRRSRGHSF